MNNLETYNMFLWLGPSSPEPHGYARDRRFALCRGVVKPWLHVK